MASLYTRKNSSYLWLKWRDPADGQLKQVSTGLRKDDAAAKRQAIHLRNQYSLKESGGAVQRSKHPFIDWVPGFLQTRHSDNPQTLQRKTGIWKTLNLFLNEISITCPTQLRREHCFKYVSWRKKLPHLNGKKIVHHNTVLLELKVLGNIMQEAVRRHYVQFNPCSRLELKRERARVKKEITEEQFQIIHKAISRRLKSEDPMVKRNADFLHISFEIARLQGIRLSETYLNLDEDIDWNNLIVTIRAKGGKDYQADINPDLVPLLKKLKAQGRTWVYDRPRMYKKKWWEFFDTLRKKHPSLKNVSFHSTRVTFVSRLERAGAPEKLTMQMVNHASTTVHRIYRRIKREELTPYWSALNGTGKDSLSKPPSLSSDMPASS